MDFPKFVEQTLFSLEFVEYASLSSDFSFDAISLIDEVVIDLDEFWILYLVDMRAFPEVERIFLKLFLPELILILLFPFGIVFFLVLAEDF